MYCPVVQPEPTSPVFSYMRVRPVNVNEGAFEDDKDDKDEVGEEEDGDEEKGSNQEKGRNNDDHPDKRRTTAFQIARRDGDDGGGDGFGRRRLSQYREGGTALIGSGAAAVEVSLRRGSRK